VVEQGTHKPLVTGSNPVAASLTLPRPTVEQVSQPTISSFESLLKQIAQLSPQERDALLSLTQSQKTSMLGCPQEGVEDWKNHMVARGLADGTIKLYTHTVNHFLEWYPLPTPRDVRNYSVMRLQKVTPTKVRNDQKALRSFFNFLEAEGLWLNNPTRGMQLLKAKGVIRQAPEKEHVDKLLTAWQGNDHRLKFRLFILLFVDTGIRILEACTLKVEDINLDRLEIKVMGKGGKERVVPISPVTAELIREYTQKNPHVRKGGYLFPYNGRDGYHSKHNLEKSFRRLCKRLGIPKITPHMLRHYFATYALRNGAKLEVISKILGHSSVAITVDVYRTVKQEEIQEEHKKYSPLAGREG
jgi:integrase/recombinase XerD